ncbi:hypothetical protein Poli38472_003505 [Pythium oligandrum]|uniref:Chitin-binding type-4 domain-containing protein n=1 Tax=Pythium oligandrum TaxID=41045 RepID=A0A8K1C6Y2_PYTOL|nr:hypothetical protein Poli38472_003505 [Pythium oligandrum]|eukprot:TMW57580.1 hypothetical protein Poli38472_003505 [Pythium oligandrum]
MVRSAAVLAALALALPAAVNAHGAMSNPAPVFKDPSNKNAPSGSVPATSTETSLKAMADKIGVCGKTDGAAPAVPIPADGVISFGISAVHVGPCEVWLGNEMVVSEQECWKKFPDFKIKVDTSKCGSGCQLRWVWLAKHNIPWEMYDNCVNLGSAGGPAPAGGSTAPAASSAAPAASSAAPAATSMAPHTMAPHSMTPAASSAAPAASSAAPAATSMAPHTMAPHSMTPAGSSAAPAASSMAPHTMAPHSMTPGASSAAPAASKAPHTMPPGHTMTPGASSKAPHTMTPGASSAAPAASSMAPHSMSPTPAASNTTMPGTPAPSSDAPGVVKPNPGATTCVKGSLGRTEFDEWCMANCAMNFCPESHCEPCA